MNFYELFNDKDPNPIVMFDDIKHTLKYETGLKLAKPQVHLGQRKLLLSEIQFLTKMDNEYILYVGSAPGNKTYLLSILFPNKKFILVDPNKFVLFLNDTDHRQIKHPDIIHIYHEYPTNSNVYKNNKKEFNEETVDFIKKSNYKIFIIEDFMTDDLAEILKKLKPTLISDIRTNILGGDYPKNIDLYWNNSMQYNWAKILGTDSLFKIRLPFGKNDPSLLNEVSINEPFKEDYINNKFGFPKSDMYIQAWASEKHYQEDSSGSGGSTRRRAWRGLSVIGRACPCLRGR